MSTCLTLFDLNRYSRVRVFELRENRESIMKWRHVVSNIWHIMPPAGKKKVLVHVWGILLHISQTDTKESNLSFGISKALCHHWDLQAHQGADQQCSQALSPLEYLAPDQKRHRAWGVPSCWGFLTRKTKQQKGQIWKLESRLLLKLH